VGSQARLEKASASTHKGPAFDLCRGAGRADAGRPRRSGGWPAESRL